MAFEDQLKKRRENDNQAMDHAFSNLISIIGVNTKRLRPLHTKRHPEDDAIRDVLASIGVKAPDVPEEIVDPDIRLTYMLRPCGVMRRRVELTGRWWRDGAGALLGSTKDGSMVAILPAFPSGYSFYDVTQQKKVRISRKNANKLNVDAFCFYRPLPAKKLRVKDLLLFMLQSVTRGDIALVFGASLLVSLLGLFTPFMNKQIFDSVIPSGTKSDVIPVAALLMGAAAGASLFGIVRSLVLGRLRDKINVSAQSAAMARIFTLPAAFYKDYTSGELSVRALSIHNLCSILSDTALTAGFSFLFSFPYLFQMRRYAPALLVPGILVILGMFIFTIGTGLIQQQISKRRMTLAAKLNGLVFGLFTGVQKVRLAGAEKRAFSKWAAAYSNTAKLTYAPPLYIKLNRAISGAIILGGSLLLYYFAGMNRMTQSDYIAFITAYGAISGAVMTLAGVAPAFADIKPLMEMVQPIFDTVPELDGSKKIVTALSGNVEVSNVTFRYDKTGPTVLDNISLAVKPGEYIAIVGKSGCGKSTLMRMLLGFEKPESGAIYYDGEDLASLDVRSVRQRLGVALQNGKLFQGDILSNILVTSPMSSPDTAWEAARMAGLYEDIKAMPMGMKTLITEGSGGISGGQKQRILIARALVSNPDILLFDEATSALDNITQKHVADSISRLGCTRIVIAHRLSTVKDCDRIIVMEKGTIAEEGTFDELMDKKGYFYESARRQLC